MKITPYLGFNGCCEAAMRHHAAVLGTGVDCFGTPSMINSNDPAVHA